MSKFLHALFRRGLLVCSLSLGGFWGLQAAPGPVEPKKLTVQELFETDRVWEVRLSFTADQWEAMEPKGEGFGPFGGGPGRGPRGGPGGRPPGGPGGGFGPGMFLGPAIMGQADADQDGSLSEAEFTALGERWFGAWDTNRSGVLKPEQVRAGLNGSLGPPGPGAGRGPGGRPGGGPGPGMSLQGPQGKRNGLSAAAGVEFPDVRADLEFGGALLKDVTVRYKGNGTFMQSRASLKRSFKIDLNDVHKGQKLAGVAKLNLHNGITDASWMNEVLSHRLFRDAGVPAPRTAYARVFVNVPGKHDNSYLGLYSLVENPDNNWAESVFGTRQGAIFKPVTPSLFDDLGAEWSAYQQTYDPKTELTPAQKQRVIDFSRLVARADDAEFAARAGDYLDLEQFARFMATTVCLSTLDSILSIGQNYVVYLHPTSNKFQFVPWDLDHSFGQFFMMGTQEMRENLDIHKPWQGEKRFLERVFALEGFKKAYLASLGRLSGEWFQSARIGRQVDELAAALRPAIAAESAEKLERFNQVVAGEAVAPAGFGPPPGGGPGRGPGGPGFGPPGFGQPVKPIKAFVGPRATSIAGQLAGTVKGATLDQNMMRPGGPGGFAPGNFLGPAFMRLLDADKNGELPRAEFVAGFKRLFSSWAGADSPKLSMDRLREGLNRDLGGPMGGPPGPPPASPP